MPSKFATSKGKIVSSAPESTNARPNDMKLAGEKP